MFLTKKFNLGLILMLFCILLSACGLSPEELAATSSAETAAAASPTPLPTSTPTPTFTPTPTPTPTLTPTPLPGPDAKAMINWEALNLPEGYLSFDHELGFGEGDWIMAAQMEDGTQIDYYIESIFTFAEQWPEAAYGWTVIYPTEFDKDVLDAYIEIFPDQLAGIVTGFGASLISLIDNTEYSDIGDNSAEAWAVYVLDGNWWSFWGATFRIDNIGGFVFLRHSFGDEQFMEIGDLAQIYAQSIEIPTYSCNFTTITPDSDSDLPAFEYKVEGFYPGEPIMVSLSGDVRVDGETQRVTMIDYDPDLTDENGKFHGIMRFGDEVLELASSEFELIIISYSSKCTVRQIVTWPGELGPASTPEPLPGDNPESTAIPGIQVIPVSSLGDGIPWLPMDEDNRPMSVYYGFNVEKPPFNNVLVRQAFAAAIDREQIAQEATHFKFRDVKPATSLTPSYILGRDLYGEVGIPFDPVKAQDLLQQAGYSSIEGFPAVTLIVSYRGEAASGAYLRMAQTIVGMWETHLGIKVDIEVVGNIGAYIDRLKTNLPDMYQLGWGADYNDPDNFLKELFHSNADRNYGNFSNQEFDRLVEKAANINDPLERQILYIEAELILTEQEAGVIPLYHTLYYLQP